MVLIIGEEEEDRLSTATRELLNLGKRIATNTGNALGLVLLGKNISSIAQQGFEYGADRIFSADSPVFNPYLADIFLPSLVPEIQTHGPALILLPHSDRGMDLAPRLAFRLETKLVTDCEDIRINKQNGSLTFIKPVFGGKTLGNFRLQDHKPQIVTMREGAVDSAPSAPGRKGEVETLNTSGQNIKARVRFIRKEVDKSLVRVNRLKTANLVIGAGRGVKSPEGVTLVEQVAELLDGAVAASRPVVDSDWLPYSLQIGLTGKKVHPRTYIAVGISGAVQHMAGCLKSGKIVAINSDESAPIFRMSHYGIVGDCRAVLNGFLDEFRKTAPAPG